MSGIKGLGAHCGDVAPSGKTGAAQSPWQVISNAPCCAHFWARDNYATASIISADRVVFNVKGNDYRLVAAVDFEKSIVWIKWIGTHRDYDKIDVREVRHGGD
ncbi:type II toxin-antitoxin system HigB family toxin [Bradyrhizobium sp. 139]|uniref:type II toxin-antitoxin system HigB family toxin n=1 Tax=Bradyrhizobium sp. 139 TaxID=2782616 RepID=UPI001FFBE9ED|nr:type II toxin-antitoxin system HigB family toxin [Bradyrhizobium sp. 139]MCK1744192.1 type II toxin-antitoxin system HigB family toxin [Bradyrhizobium sp. 139]